MKNPRTRLVLTLGLLVAAIVGLFRLGGDRAPDVEFRTLAGERVRLGELRGKPVLVVFWASDCRGCIEEIPDLSALHRDYSRRGLEVIAVAMPYDPPNRVVKLVKTRELAYRVALDPLGQVTAAFGGVKLVPNSFLIAPDGRVTRHTLGRLHAEEIRADIERLLGKV